MTYLQKQCLLAYLGYYPHADIDGQWGPASRQATEAFQRDFCQSVDGIWGSETEGRILEVIYNREQPPKAEESFWDHIKYFTRAEFKCRCGEYHAPYCNGYPVEPDQTLVELADDIRAHFGRPAHPTSGIRCRQHNADQKNSAANSRHLSGKALDFWIEGITGEDLKAYAKSDPRTAECYIIQDNIVHVGVK